MSDKQQLLFVSLGILFLAIISGLVMFFLTREVPIRDTLKEGEAREEVIDNTIHVRTGKITAISLQGTSITILSEKEEEFSFSVDGADIAPFNNQVISFNNLTLGMEIESRVQRGRALSLSIIYAPSIAIISPAPNTVLGLSFNIEGVLTNKKGDVCLTLSNRRTGVIYENQVSTATNENGTFSFPINLSYFLDAERGDVLDAKFNICGEEESTSISWQYYSGVTVRVRTYFFQNSCANLRPVERVVSASKSSMRFVIEEIINGPNKAEEARGLFSITSDTASLRSINVLSNVFYIDFRPNILNVSRCSVSALREQINRTVNQFPIEDFVITIEGEENNPLN